MSIKKAVQVFQDLAKMDPSLSEALRAFRATGMTEHANTIARHLFSDSMVPKMGNKLAYQEHLSRHGNEGTHVHVDLADFGQINKLHGEQTGDQAIKDFGNTASDVSRMFGGKAFRNGGDEFKFWFDKPEAAHAFARELRTRVEKLPPAGGTHNIAATIGIGHNPQHAEGALINAKSQLGPMVGGKRQNLHAVGKAPTIIHSLAHEPTPEGWKPGKGVSERGTAPVSHVPAGLNLKNPLR